MRVVTVFKDEFKRSSWIIFIVLGCMLLVGAMLTEKIEEVTDYILVSSGWFNEDVNVVSWYLPVAALLALSQKRTRKDDFWGSMPYTADSLYLLRLAYGLMFIAAVGVVQMLLSAAIMHKNAFIIEDLRYIGLRINGVYDFPRFMLVNGGAYILASTICTLVNNHAVAAAFGFFASLMPEMLFTPYNWITGEYWHLIEYFSDLKYVIAFGINDNVNDYVYQYGVPVYLCIIAAMLFIGAYVNRKTAERGNSKVFYNRFVKVIYIILCVLFALNVFETLFLQGGF